MNVNTAVPIEPSTAAGFGDIGDIAFALAAYQLDNLDTDLGMRLESLNAITEIKKAYRERISQLQDLLNNDLPDADSKAWIDADLGNKAEFSMGPDGITNASSDFIGSDFRAHGTMMSGGEEYGTPTDTTIHASSYEDANAMASELQSSVIEVEVSREGVETEIARLQGKMDELSGEGELGLLAINRLLGKRNQVMQLASNMLSSSHQSAMGIISNIK